MNALAFCASVFLLWLLLRTLVPERPALAWVVAALWLLHPAPVVSVHWVVGRVDTHSVFPMLLAVVFHLRHRRGAGRLPVILALLWAFASKESAIGLPLVLLGIDFLDRHPSLARGAIAAGRALPALPYLLVIPLFFVFRYFVLGTALGGYGFLAMQDFDLVALLDGLRQSLGQSLAPSTGPVVQNAACALVLGFVTWWALAVRGRRAIRIAGVLLVSAGIWGPLAQLLPSMRDPGQQRYAYSACLWALLAWTGCCAVFASRLVSRGAARELLVTALALAPLLLLMPERAREVEKMKAHDAFCTDVVEATRSILKVDPRILYGDNSHRSPIVLAGDAELANHPQRLLWGLGAYHAPPFRHERIEAVSLRKIAPYASEVPLEVAVAGARGWIELEAGAGGVARDHVRTRPGTKLLRRSAEPVAFDGTLREEDWQRLVAPDCAIGFACATDVSYVAVMTSVGSAHMKVASRDKVLHLRDLLLSDVGFATGAATGVPLIHLVLNPLDLAPHSPIFLAWRSGDGVAFAELRAERAFTRRAIRELSVSLGGK